MRRILIVTPIFPFPEAGADQYERAGNMRQLVRLGYEVHVIAKVRSDADQDVLQHVARDWGIELTTVPYRYSNRALTRRERIAKFLGKCRNPLYFDGAAYEYAEAGIQVAVARALETFTPNIVWFDYSYLWPLYHLVSRRGIPIVTRPINFEPTHLLEEEGHSLLSYLKYLPKCIGELLVIKKSALIVALSPQEAAVYRRLGARHVFVVPLRGLPQVLRDRHEIRSGPPLHVAFMGSTFSVGHNERALDLVTGTLAPRAAREYPGAFVFHVSGARIPSHYLSRFDGQSLVFEDYIDRDQFDQYLNRMDIALAPSPKKVGMQQKVYEPLCRGIPLIAPTIATGGYPLESGVHYLAAETADEYFGALLQLRDSTLRASLSRSAIDAATQLFSADACDAALRNALHTLASTPHGRVL